MLQQSVIVVPQIFSSMQADLLHISREAPGKENVKLTQKSYSSLSSSAGCLLDYLKTEEGSQLNLPKLIDMSAQVSEHPLGNRLKTMTGCSLSEILTSPKSVRFHGEKQHLLVCSPRVSLSALSCQCPLQPSDVLLML